METQCDQCGQTDDHPKVFVDHDRPTASTYHYDCLPYKFRSEELKHAVYYASTGLKGNKLREAIMRGKL